MQKANGRDILRRKPHLRSPTARMLKDELLDFNTATKPKKVLLEELRPVVRRLRLNRPMTAGSMAVLLNAEGLRTAQDRRWNERRVILLLRLLSLPPLALKASRRKGRLNTGFSPSNAMLERNQNDTRNVTGRAKVDITNAEPAKKGPLPSSEAQVIKLRRLAQKRAREGSVLVGVVIEKAKILKPRR